MNLPNALTISRIAFAILIVILLLSNSLTGYIWATVLFAIAALTDFYDGYLAKKYGMVGDFGIAGFHFKTCDDYVRFERAAWGIEDEAAVTVGAGVVFPGNRHFEDDIRVALKPFRVVEC